MFSASSAIKISKNIIRMDVSNRTVSTDKINQEWLEIQAAQRSPARFGVLYNRYYEPIFRYIYRRCLQEDIAADICSQVFLKAMQKLNKYQFKGVPFSAWLYRIASNEVSQYYRNEKKTRTVAMEDSNIGEMFEEMEIDELEPYKGKLLEALEQLAPKDLQLIEMRFFEQRPFKEIASILDITESNAKVKTYRLLNRMKKFLAANKAAN